MFTDRFIKVEVFMYSDEEESLYNRKPEDCDLISCVRYINPIRIESFGEAIPRSDFREDNKVWTKVTMQSNDDFVIPMTLDSFKELLNKHQQ